MTVDFEDYRMGHLVRTAEVWKQILELGATTETKLNFDFSFTTKSKEAVGLLKSNLSDYILEIDGEGIIRKTYRITGSSGPIVWDEEKLLKWVDYLNSSWR